MAQDNFSSASDEPIRVLPALASAAATEFRLPSRPKYFGATQWLARGQSIVIAGVTIPGGMIYVGSLLKTFGDGGGDPAVINPAKAVAAAGDYTKTEVFYQSGYADISANARRAYLDWLAGGASDAKALIGYVYLYFYGLERRAVIELQTDAAALAELPIIAAELRRLMAMVDADGGEDYDYDDNGEFDNGEFDDDEVDDDEEVCDGDYRQNPRDPRDFHYDHPHYYSTNAAFLRHAKALLHYCELRTQCRLYARALPDLIKSYELPLVLRLALGQAALDAAPVSPALALAWLKYHPDIYLRTAAIRCAEQFDALFEIDYRAQFGAGMIIAGTARKRKNLTALYRPASRGLSPEMYLPFGATPDVSSLTEPVDALRAVAELATDALDAFSRVLGRKPGASKAFEGMLVLPECLWPASWRARIAALQAEVAHAPVPMPLPTLLVRLGATDALNKERALQLARLCAQQQIGIEPDFIDAAKLPKPDAWVVLFRLDTAEPPRTVLAYQAALLTLDVAAAVALAERDFADVAFDYLCQYVRALSGLEPSQQQRLLAHLQLLRRAPVPLSALKKRMVALDASAKHLMALFMVDLVQLGGRISRIVSVPEMQALEAIYKALQMDAKQVFSDVHAAPTRSPRALASETFKLDPVRIAMQQLDTAQAAALLSGIFNEGLPEPSNTPPLTATAAPTLAAHAAAATLLGLDAPHAALVKVLLSRAQWPRSELLIVAADLDLMLDGALERINEAAFDCHDLAFTEGDDVIDINQELREKISA